MVQLNLLVWKFIDNLLKINKIHGIFSRYVTDF